MGDQQAFPRLNTPFVERNLQIAIPWYKVLIALWNRTGGASGNGGSPTGVVAEWAGSDDASAIPDGWLLCDGTAISRSSFADLFAVIGVNYGAGDGVNTFNLPDFRGRTALGVQDGTYDLGTTGGSATTVLDVTQMPAGFPSITDPGHNHTQDPHTHPQSIVNTGTAGTNGSQGANVSNTTTAGTTGSTVATNQSSTTGITVDAQGSGAPVSLLSPYLAINKIIKT